MADIIRPNYKYIPLIRGWNLTNFPFIEADFDAITSYQLWCKIVQYVNELIKNMDLTEKTVLDLYDYVYNYFATLDVQDEINNKLDEMSESGQLADIIAIYLNSNAIMAYNTVADMKASTNLVNGSFARTYGKLTYNDGYGNFYKIREVLSTDVVDDDNIVSITADPTIIAEKIPNKYLSDAIDSINDDIDNIEDNILDLETKINNKESKRKFILVGDSYAEGYGNQDLKGWAKYVIEYCNTNNMSAQEIYEGGSGFVHVGNSGHTFKTLLQTLTVENPDSITDIVVVGGYNDHDSSQSVIEASIEQFIEYCKETYINAKISIGMAGNNSTNNDGGMLIRNDLTSKVLPAYKNCVLYGANYLNGVEFSTHFYNNFYNDGVHLTDYSILGRTVYNILMGYGSNIYGKETTCTYTDSGLPNFRMYTTLNDGICSLRLPQNVHNNVSFNWTSNYVEITNSLNIPYMRYTQSASRITIPVDVDITYSGGTTKDTAYLVIENTRVVYLFTRNSYSNVTRIVIQANEVAVNTIGY